MFGKHFSSMYTGSMRGKGSAFFAVWGYIIAHGRPDWKGGMNVELNPEIMHFLIGEDEGVIRRILEEMCGPDEKSRTPDHDGRKLIQLSEYTYKIVNGMKYRGIKDEFARQESNRESQARFQAKKKAAQPKNGKPLAGEQAYCRAAEAGNDPNAEDYAPRPVPSLTPDSDVIDRL